MTRYLLLVGVLAALALPAGAADPPARSAAKATPAGVPWWVPPAARDLEAVRMYFAIRGGSMMGPADGWFGPSESRYTWRWLADKYGLPAAGELRRPQFQGSDARFARLDRDGDGAIRPDDFDWGADSPYVRQLGQARQWLARADRDGDGALTKKEWEALFDKAAAGGDALSPEEVRRLLFPPAPPRPKGPPSDMPTKDVLLAGLFSGEIGSPFPGPKVGQKAPDFTLRTSDGSRAVSLSSFRGKRPVVLVFGSFT